MIRVILDANIYISALLKPTGSPSQLLQKGLDGAFETILSEAIFLEICRVLNYKKIKERLSYTDDQIKKFLERLVDISSWTSDEIAVAACEDPKDDIYLSCAKESQANFLVSGDEHLLKIKNFEETRIVTTRQFLDYLQTGSNLL